LLKDYYLLFFDKKDLNNGTSWFIRCAMNVQEIALILLAFGIYIAFRFHECAVKTEAQTRLNRIRYVARFFKWICCAGFGFMIFVAAIAIFMPAVIVKNINPSGPLSISGPIWLGEFKPEYQWLYSFFWLCLAAFLCWFISFFYRLFSNLEKGIIFGRDNVRYIRDIGLWSVVTPLLGLGFELSKFIWATEAPIMIDVSHVFNGFLEGFFVIFIAWIMDEGRKIQEEQELTV
jgi:hypothetical protein